MTVSITIKIYDLFLKRLINFQVVHLTKNIGEKL